MAEEICEKVRISAMALADGITPEMAADEIEQHIAECSQCHSEVERMQAMMSLLDSQKRQDWPVNLWGEIEQRLDEESKQSKRVWRAFILAAVLLLGFKIVELAPERDLGLALKVVPLLIAIAVFAYLKENPFKIKMDLKVEGEKS
jgi:anti-sigma factor RsiW